MIMCADEGVSAKRTCTVTTTGMPIQYKASMWLRSAHLPLMDRHPRARRSALSRHLPRIPPSMRRQECLVLRPGTCHMPTSTVGVHTLHMTVTNTLRLLQDRQSPAMARTIGLGIKAINRILRLSRHRMQATDKIHTPKAIRRSSQKKLSVDSIWADHLGHRNPICTRSPAILPPADSMNTTPVESRTRPHSARVFTGATTDIPSSMSEAGQRTCRLLAIRRRK